MPGVQKVDISSSSILRTIFILMAFGFVYIIRDIVLMLLAAIILAAAIEPVANRLQKQKIPRALSVLLVYVVVIAVLAVAITVMVPPLVDQVGQLARALPGLLEQGQTWLGGRALPIDTGVVSNIQSVLLRVGDSAATVGVRVFEGTYSFFSGTFTVLFVFVLSFYLVVEQDALKKMFKFLVPKQHYKYVELVIDRSQQRVGRWVIAQLSLAVIIGVIVGLGLWLLGVPYALALGLLAGLMEFIPVIGPILAAIPAVLVAVTQSLWLGIATVIFYIVVQQTENHLLVPNIMKKAVGLSPLVTLIAVLLGARLAGVVGVILSVPIATIITVILSSLLAKNPDELAG